MKKIAIILLLLSLTSCTPGIGNFDIAISNPRIISADKILERAPINLEYIFMTAIHLDWTWLTETMPKTYGDVLDEVRGIQYKYEFTEDNALLPSEIVARGYGDCDDTTLLWLARMYRLRALDSHPNFEVGFVCVYPEPFIEGSPPLGHVAPVYYDHSKKLLLIMNITRGKIEHLRFSEFTYVMHETYTPYPHIKSLKYRFWYLGRDVKDQPPMREM